MRTFGLIAVVGAALLALLAGVIGYSIGLGVNVAASGTTVVHPLWGFGFFHPLIGLIFFILLFVLVFALVRRAAWGGGYGRYGGPWGHRAWSGPVPPMADEMLQHWHRQAHGEPSSATYGNATHGNATHGNATHGNATHGSATHGNATTDNATTDNATAGDATTKP